MKRIIFGAGLALCLNLFAAGASTANAATVDSINAASDPFFAASWNVPDVGWIYSPPTSFSVSSIGTKFGSSDGRTVTAAIFLDTPGSLVLLGAGELVPVANAFAYRAFLEAALFFITGVDTSRRCEAMLRLAETLPTTRRDV
jgi:hypothetical protein